MSTRRSALPVLALLLTLAGCASPTSSSGPSATATPPSSATLKPGGENHVHSILVMPANPQDIYLGTHFRLVHSLDGGKTWHQLLSQPMYSMALDPGHPETMYGYTRQSGFLRSLNGGRHWSAPAGAPPRNQLIGLIYDSHTHTLLLYGAGLYRSVDGGRHFTHLLPRDNVDAAAAGSGNTLYAASLNDLMVSRDDGLHWSMTNVGPAIQVVAAGTWAYAVSPLGLYRSLDNGKSWHLLAAAPQSVEFLGTAPTDPNVLIVETGAKGFSRSIDGGKTWQPANNGIAYHNFTASTVRFAPSSSRIAYTGAWGLHFYATHDAGLHWVQTAVLAH